MVAETRGDSDRLLTGNEEAGLLRAVRTEDVAIVELGFGAMSDGIKLDSGGELLGATDDEVSNSELGMDRVTGSTVDRTEVVGGGGVKVVARSVDNAGVEYTSLSETSGALEVSGVSLVDGLYAEGISLSVVGGDGSLLMYGVEKGGGLVSSFPPSMIELDGPGPTDDVGCSSSTNPVKRCRLNAACAPSRYVVLSTSP